jgi:hypothetical protein
MIAKKIAVALSCVAVLCVGVAQAKTLVQRNVPVDDFQGVDATAQLDGGAFLGIASATGNLKTGKATVTGRAVVPNLSFKKVTFIDQEIVAFGGATFVSSKYTVAANGRATYSAKYAGLSL